jgi:two-component system sensor histidine kinase DctS
VSSVPACDLPGARREAPPPAAPVLVDAARAESDRISARDRALLWTLMVALVAGMLVTLVWLAGRYEASQVQERVERDVAEAVADLRTGFSRDLQSLQALQGQAATLERWLVDAAVLMRAHREWLRIELRDARLATLAHAGSPFRPPAFDRLGRDNAQSDVALACGSARRNNGPAFSRSYFLPLGDGVGLEVMELCLPQPSQAGGAFVIVSVALQELLAERVGRQLSRSQAIWFAEPDGTRLAMHGSSQRATRVFTAQQLLDLPGTTLVVRIDSWRAAPDLFPNVLTALVTLMSLALVTVLFVLSRDMRRRLRAERELADALAFRKAMEDSLVTGLRARDLQGRITYVNPAFCGMVGFTADELLGRSAPAPYWPPELVDEYSQRQAIRLSGQNAPPREGYESVFMRKDGARFPVLVIEAPLINAQGVQTGWMSAIVDVSEQRRVEELSRASQDRLQATARLATMGEMASLLSHELNQPLAAIASYASGSINLMRAPQGAGQGADLSAIEGAMRRIAEQADRAGKVIKSVHDFVRRRERDREMLTPAALVDSVMPLVSLQARKLQVRVETQLAPGLPPLTCDRTMVEQVLLNLARNAMQAMEQVPLADRVLLLRVQPVAAGERGARRWLEFAVVDRGPGIAPEVAERLFTPLFTTKAEGMGLGLSLCRTVIEQHGGALSFEPHPAGGTIFRFTLPVQPA